MSKKDDGFKERRSMLLKHRFIWILIYIANFFILSIVLPKTILLIFDAILVYFIPIPLLILAIIDIVLIIIISTYTTNKIYGKYDLG